ncbi:MAG: hypothetical protein M0Z69_04345 [Actinomycetota bacterium]|nr:hypothetical protein [Actinomycetota bacterium]
MAMNYEILQALAHERERRMDVERATRARDASRHRACGRNAASMRLALGSLLSGAGALLTEAGGRLAPPVGRPGIVRTR